MRLQPEDRAQIAEELLASLDDMESDVELAWSREIESRAADARVSQAGEEDWRTALADVQREVLKR